MMLNSVCETFVNDFSFYFYLLLDLKWCKEKMTSAKFCLQSINFKEEILRLFIE